MRVVKVVIIFAIELMEILVPEDIVGFVVGLNGLGVSLLVDVVPDVVSITFLKSVVTFWDGNADDDDDDEKNDEEDDVNDGTVDHNTGPSVSKLLVSMSVSEIPDPSSNKSSSSVVGMNEVRRCWTFLLMLAGFELHRSKLQ